MFGTRSLRVDLVDPDIKLKPTISSRALPLITFPAVHKDGSFAQVKVVGPLAEFEYLSRNNEVSKTFFHPCSLSDLTCRNRPATMALIPLCLIHLSLLTEQQFRMAVIVCFFGYCGSLAIPKKREITSRG